MKKISLVVAPSLCQNNIFSTTDRVLNFDNILLPLRIFRDKMLECGYDLATYDINPPAISDLVFYFDIDSPVPKIEEKDKSFLFIWECPIIAPDFYNPELHSRFNKVFTVSDNLVDNNKYFKINYLFILPKQINKELNHKIKLCALISANKTVRHKLELYSKRIEAIRWFEQKALSDFDLYGRSWNKYVAQNMFVRKAMHKSKPFRKFAAAIFYKKFVSYRGEIEFKVPVLERYKFCICYENARDIPGYITEKIFHSFFAGCVPVYWGANNITDYIPSNCFIDKRKFSSYAQLYKFLRNISDAEYLQYLNNIECYLNSPEAQVFSAENFSQTVLNVITHES